MKVLGTLAASPAIGVSVHLGDSAKPAPLRWLRLAAESVRDAVAGESPALPVLD